MTETLPSEAASSAGAAGTRIIVSAVRRVFETGVVALDGLSLDIAAGQFVAILGPSGCGKSTLLRLIAGLDTPQGGSIEMENGSKASASANSLATHAADIAYVFQDAHLLPWRTVLRNVELPLELMRLDKAARRAHALEALRRVGLHEAAARYPAQLSGGMRMRVSLARALVTRPKLLLLDEPFAALDEITRQHLDEQLRQLWAGSGMTVVFVTHSTAEAVFLAQRAIVLSKRPGRIVADHAIDLPPLRAAETRSTPDFARQTQVVYEALARGGA